MGKSYVFGEPVWEVIKKRFPISVYFGLIGFFITYIVCIPLGIVKAIRHGQKFDFISSVVVFFGYSMPGWTFGALTLMLFGGGGFFNIFPFWGMSIKKTQKQIYTERDSKIGFRHRQLPLPLSPPASINLFKLICFGVGNLARIQGASLPNSRFLSYVWYRCQ